MDKLPPASELCKIFNLMNDRDREIAITYILSSFEKINIRTNNIPNTTMILKYIDNVQISKETREILINGKSNI